jgi:uncharacterized protein involved in copper resistance
MAAGQGVTQSRLNTASRLAAATAILVGGGYSIANPVAGTVDASAPGITPSRTPSIATAAVVKGGGQDAHGPKGHHHGPGATSRDHEGIHHRKQPHQGTDHDGMDREGMNHEGMDHAGMAHDGMEDKDRPDRGTHRHKKH